MIDIQWLISTGPCKKITEGQYVPCPGGPDGSDRAMYILLSGRVDVYKQSAAGGKQVAGSILPGDVFGGREYFLNAQDQSYLSAVDSVVFIINEESFNDLSWSRPEILFDVLKASYMPLKKMTAAEEAKTKSAQKKSATAEKPAGAPKAAAGAPKAAAAGTPKAAGTPGKTEQAAADKFKPSPHKDLDAIRDRVASAGVKIDLFPQGHKHMHFTGFTRPDYSKFVFAKEYKCPACSRAFKDFKIFRSKLYEAKPMRYDLRKFFTGFRAEWYEILTCHNCMFSMFSNYFTDPKPVQKAIFEKELAAARANVHMDFNSERDLEYVFTSHYLALLCAEGYKSHKRQIKAKVWGNLSWLYEDAGIDENLEEPEEPQSDNDRADDLEMMVYAASKAAEEYEAIYAETNLTTVQEQITCLSIAGMQHRAGIDRDMKRYLFKAKTMQGGDSVYSKLAEDFMYEMKISEEN